MGDEIAAALGAAGFPAAEEEARILRQAGGDRLLDGLTRRLGGEPLEWIVGRLEFSGIELEIAPGIYVPRRQSEELARRAAALLPEGGRAADLCTGCGAVARYLMDAVAGARVVAVDIDEKAVACARRNGVPAVRADLGGALRHGAFDLVTAVVPYVPTEELAFLPSDVRAFEPLLALDGGPGGVVLLEEAVFSAARLLRPGGHVCLELGGDQDVLLAPALERAGFGRFLTWRDAEGDLRGLVARLGQSPREPRP